MNKLTPILCSVFRVRPEDIKDGASMQDIPGWDSLTHMDLIATLEQAFDVQFTGDEIADMRSVQAIRALLAKTCRQDGYQE
jgi:acyl carrier protein